ncbi:MAG: homoserine dehydrogenase [Deltaproteobacteria bacterium]|nr:homoserine dehydrogenase [Deltaproteobacteria bacterium]
MENEKAIQIGLIGLGTVGSGVATILKAKEKSLEALVGRRLVLKKIAELNPERARALGIPEEILTARAEDILEDPEIQIVIELIGGKEPAKTFIRQALLAGKHVVTANKALLAEAGNELFLTAREQDRHIGFEASVCGGIPIILALRQGLVANEIESIFGIMNGTSNFILSRMTEEGQPYQQALEEAQKLGYAEADPTLDVEGHDTAHKLAILMHLAYGLPMDLSVIHTEGITRITPLDLAFAREFGYRVKLLAICRKENGLVEARVHPTMIPVSHMLSNVSGAYNALFIHGDAVGDILLYGLGAGMMPTGSAVVSDLVDIGRNINLGITRRIPRSSVSPEERGAPLAVKPFEEIETHYYCRISALDRPGVLSKVSGILGEHGISIASVIQKGRDQEGAVPIVMMTHGAQEKALQEAIGRIDQLPFITDRTMVIRVEDPSLI